ncbi:MAG TPA: adenine deaminase [Phycisphaerales bacterium]|nr:adenine deaminase [Phycisphaerales bacterium]
MERVEITPEMMKAARGDAPADLILSNARVVNVFTGEVLPANIAVFGGRVIGVGDLTDAREVVDVRGAHVGPGFIDAHMHVESTMLPVSGFAGLAVPRGTTGAVFDPHEIANVLGIEGIRWLMRDAEDAPMNARFAVSSCVPSSPLETAGACLSARDLEPLFDDERVVALAEMMNFPGVFMGDQGVLEKVNLGLRKRMVDGHSPGLRGRNLGAYVAAGISSDHECTTIEEAREKLRLGMRVFIREGSAARNLEALLPLVTPATRTRFCFCTDDRHPGDLRDEGHIDHVVRKAIRLGMDPVMAIACGSLHTAEHFRLWGPGGRLGAVAPGYQADLVVFDELNEPRAKMVFVGGKLVARDGELVHAAKAPVRVDRWAGIRLGETVKLPRELDEESFRVPVKGAGAKKIRVIVMDPHQIVTGEAVVEARVEGGAYVADPGRDVLKLCVIERHRATGNIGRGFVRGFGFKGGALASTVGHDSHNLAVVGSNDRDMLVAARALEKAGGGQCVVRGGEVLALLPLPIAGLMSDQPAAVVIEQQKKLLEASRAIGCPHHDPFMPLSFLPLPVIPKLKLTDLGLVDVEKFAVVGLEAD